jgi:hypothetical protein
MALDQPCDDWTAEHGRNVPPLAAGDHRPGANRYIVHALRRGSACSGQSEEERHVRETTGFRPIDHVGAGERPADACKSSE